MLARAQIFSADFLVSILLVTYLLVSSLAVSQAVAEKQLQREADATLSAACANALEQLVSNPGHPLDWQKTGVGDADTIGLANTRNEISWEKTSLLLQTQNGTNDYEHARELLMLNKEGVAFEYAARMLWLNGTEFASTEHAANYSASASTQRALVQVNNTPAVLELTVWVRS